MSVGLRIRPEAEADLLEASGWYEGRRAGLGDEFLLEADRCLTLIQENPRLCAEIHRSVRRALLKRFPYGVFYILEQDTAIVLAVLHQTRSPELWP
jgi:toxin ParE1/3/4